MKQVGKLESFFRCEKVVADKSKSGNNIFVVTFVDNLNRKYKHYISFNQRSLIWLFNLMFGSGLPLNFEDLLIRSEIMHEDPFAYCRGKIFKCVWSVEKYGPIVSEIYDLDKNFLKKDLCYNRYREGYYKNILAGKEGRFQSDKDYGGIYYNFEGKENG